MTVTSGFFNSKNHDRLYDAEQISSMFDGIIIDGVYENYGDAFNVTAFADANSTVIVGTGRAWFDHTWTLNNSQFSITMDPPNEMLGRTDAIVIDVDRRESVRKNSIIYVRGSESSTDLPPKLIDEELHKQYPICYISRPAGSNKPVSQSDITITVGTSVCPIVTGVLEAQNLDNLLQQLNAEFDEWWDGIKETLDDNIATNLQNQINDLRAMIDSDDALVGLLEKPVAEAFMNGTYGLSIKTYTLPFSQNIDSTVPTEDWRLPASNVNRRYDFYQKPVTLLPNGKTVRIIKLVDGSGGYQRNTCIQVCVANTNGVCTYYNKVIMYSEQDTSGDQILFSPHVHICDGGIFLANYNIDVFPVWFDIVMGSIGEASPLGGSFVGPAAASMRITITSEGVVSFGELSKVHTVKQVAVTSSAYDRLCTVSYPTPSGSYVYFGFDGFDSSQATAANGCAWKVSSAGVLTAPVVASATSGTRSKFVYTSNERICDYIGNNPVYANTQTSWTSIDENSLQATYHTDSLPSMPRTYVTKYPMEVYTLSEQKGVMKSSAVMGGANTFSDSKKSNYFLGASNSGNAIPQGTFLAANVDDRLYGIGPSGEQIAIGKNGGAAVLNAKQTVSQSIDKTNVVKWLKGMLNFDGKTYYLQDGTNPSVIVIGRN